MPTVEVNLQGNSLKTVGVMIPPEVWHLWLHTWLVHLSPDLSPIEAYELSIQFVSDQAIAELNDQYRQQNHPTDVLSFAALDDAPLAPEILAEIPFNLGDLVISVETAQQQCAAHGHSLREELAWLTSHGFLHLLGWDHPDEVHLREMLAIQRELLSRIGMNLENSEYFS